MRYLGGVTLLSVLLVGAVSSSIAGGPDAVGGGYTGNGIYGEYFASPDLSGTAAFSRYDVRIDFDWGTLLPIGGSKGQAYRTFPHDNFSVRWTGSVIARFTEAYTFLAQADEGVRVYFKAHSSSTWNTIIDQWSAVGATYSSAQALTAGSVYDIRVEYHNISGAASCRLLWLSHNTPLEVINPVTQQALNATSWGAQYEDYIWADKAKSSRWGSGTVDSCLWPTRDSASMVMSEMDPSDSLSAGTHLLMFTGEAQITTGCCNTVKFTVGAQTYTNQLPWGVGYNSSTNTTTALMNVNGSRLVDLRFVRTSRNGTTTNTGITNIKMMRPTTYGDTVPHDTSEVVHQEFKRTIGPLYTCLRWLQGANGNFPSSWAQRCRPNYMMFSDSAGCENYEYLVMLANETGKDIYFTLPILADDDFLGKFARLLKYGSDGNLPYSAPQANPLYPPLNANLHAYIEFGNEIWNWGFGSTQAAQQACKAESLSNSATWQQINYDGNAGPAVWCNGIRRWQVIRTVHCSDSMRAVFGDSGMGPRVRMLTEYQYDDAQGSASSSYSFFDDWYNNADANHVATPHPACYYLWGGGGATYYGVGNPIGSQSANLVTDSGFEIPAIAAGTMQYRPSGSPWTFTGTAGIYYQNGSTVISPLGTPNVAPQGHQAAFIYDSGAVTGTVNFTQTGWFAVAFNAAYSSVSSKQDQFDIYFDTILISPRSQNDIRPNVVGGYAGLGGWSRSTTDLTSEWGSAMFHVTTTGQHTIKFKGRGLWGQMDTACVFIDNVRIESADSLLASGFGSGQALGQVASANYVTQLNSQAKYARTFGLQVVAYEAGWSVGGDFTQRPLQNWCKMMDARAGIINDTAEAIWERSGSAMQCWGVYTYWPDFDFANAATYSIMLSLNQIANQLRQETNNGKLVPCMLRGIYQTDDVSWSLGGNRNALAKRGDFASWLFVVPERAVCILKVWSRGASGVNIEVDGQQIKALATSGVSDTFSTECTKGGHAVRAVSASGQVTVDSIQISYVPVSVLARSVTMATPEGTPVVTATASSWAPASAASAPEAASGGRETQFAPNESAPSSVTRSPMVAMDAPVDVAAPGTTALHPPAGVRGDGFTAPAPVATADAFVPPDTRWQPPYACLPVASVSSSSARAPHSAAASADRDLRTRWSPGSGGPQWVQYDLGSAQEVAGATVVWYAAHATQCPYAVEVSRDGVTFTCVYRGTLSGRGTHTSTCSFAAQAARYVRVRIESPSSSTVPSLYEVGLHGATGPRG